MRSLVQANSRGQLDLREFSENIEHDRHSNESQETRGMAFLKTNSSKVIPQQSRYQAGLNQDNQDKKDNQDSDYFDRPGRIKVRFFCFNVKSSYNKHLYPTKTIFFFVSLCEINKNQYFILFFIVCRS